MLQIKKDIELLIEQFEAEGPAQQPEIGICGACEKPILDTDATNRGVHSRCYKKLHREVQAGRMSWEELEDRGIVKHPQKQGRKPTKFAFEDGLPIDIQAEMERQGVIEPTKKKRKK